MQSLSSRKVMVLIAIFLFLGSIFWSILHETLLPLARAERWAALVVNLIGIPLVLAGCAAFVWGGWRFVISTAEALTHSEQPANHKQARGALFKAWVRPLLWLLGGFGLMALGGLISNL